MLNLLFQEHWILLLAIFVSFSCQVFILMSCLEKINPGDQFLYENKEPTFSPSLQKSEDFEKKTYQEDLQDIEKDNFFLTTNKNNQ